MKNIKIILTMGIAIFALKANAQLDAPSFKVFQFPANMIPRIDGDASDWDMGRTYRLLSNRRTERLPQVWQKFSRASS